MYNHACSFKVVMLLKFDEEGVMLAHIYIYTMIQTVQISQLRNTSILHSTAKPTTRHVHKGPTRDWKQTSDRSWQKTITFWLKVFFCDTLNSCFENLP